MFHYSSKTTSIVGLSVLMSGMLLANDPVNPSQLGQECAQLTMKGLIQLIKHDDKGMRRSQKRVAGCIKQAVGLKSFAQRKLFLEAGIKALQDMNVNNNAIMLGTKVYHLELGDRAYAIFVKCFGIEVFKKALDSVRVMSWGQGRASGWGNTALFSGLPFTSEQETYKAFAKASTQAFRDAYNSEESEEAVAHALEAYLNADRGTEFVPGSHLCLGSTRLALELIEGQFGDRVAEFVCGAHLFAPLN